jgi:hypothetical protein
VTLQVPKGYESYARVLHPASDSEGNPVRWAEVAEACGTSAHREMQWDALTGSLDPCAAWGPRWSGNRPLTGAMDTDELDALCEILSAHTADSGQCCFGLCTIEGWLDSFSADELELLLRLPMDRDYIVLAGPLAVIDQIVRDWSKGGASVAVSFAWKGDGTPPAPSQCDRNIREPPHLIWPADHSWFVVSEVDFDSTLVGGSAALIEAIVESSELEAWQVEPTTSLACDADEINGASDRGG